MARINLFAQALSSLAPGGAVAAVPTDAGGPPLLDAWAALGRTSSTAHAPVFQNGALVFDGVAEALVQWPRAALSATYSLPDALGTDAGKGFTITGLAYDPTDGTWWAGNHGIDIQVYDKLIPNQTSLVHLSLGADGVATKLAEFPLAGAANGPAVALLRTVQGVAVDTSDHTLWVADYDGYIYHVSVTGTILGRIQPTGVPNGLAYDSKRDALIYNSETTNRNIVYTISKTDAHVLSRVYVRGSVVDHIVYDATRDRILVTYGPNNATQDPYEGGKVDAIDMDPTSSTYGLKVAGLTSEALNAVEGIAIGPDGALYLADDGYHHLVSPANTINRIDSGLSPQPILGSHFDLGLTGWLSRSSGADAALISWDNPLEGPGVGLFVPAGTTDRIQLYANTANSTGRFGALFTGLDLTARHTYDFDINLSARTVGLYVDHVLTATQALQTGGAIGAGELQLAGVQGDLSGALTDFAPLNLQQAVADGRVQFGAAGIKPAAGDAGVQFISLAGVDQFTATSGPDRFVYATAADSPVSAHDVIDGFATGDLIDVARAQGATAALVVDGGVSFVGYAPDVSGNYQGFIQVDSVIGGDAIVAGGALLYLYGGSHGAVLAGSAAPDVIIGGVGPT